MCIGEKDGMKWRNESVQCSKEKKKKKKEREHG
jgi:hypothetical protein